MKRPPNALSLEELQKMLDESNKDETPEILAEDYKNDVLGFISAYKLTTGENSVRKDILYTIYTQWSKEPVSRKIFSNVTIPVIGNNSRSFLLNQEAINLIATSYKIIKSKEKDRSKSPVYREIFDSFCGANGLKPGNEWIQYCVALHLYKTWAKENKGRGKLGTNTFSSLVDLSFETCKTHKYGENLKWLKVHKSFYETHSKEKVLSLMKDLHDLRKETNQNRAAEKKSRRKKDKTCKVKIPST